MVTSISSAGVNLELIHIPLGASNHKFTRKPFERNQDIVSKLSSVCSISLQKSSLIISDTSNSPSLLELRLCSALCSSSNLLMYEFISSMFTSGMELVSLDLGFFSGSPGDRSALISNSTSLHRLLYSSTLFCCKDVKAKVKLSIYQSRFNATEKKTAHSYLQSMNLYSTFIQYGTNIVHSS